VIIFDGIIEKLQQSGGVSVYFQELTKRIENCSLKANYLNYSGGTSFVVPPKFNVINSNSRLLERYRDVDLSSLALEDSTLFHSSYYRLPKGNGSKVVTTVHDFTYEKYISGSKLMIHKWQKYRAIKSSDIVICVSENTASDLLEYCPIDKNKIRVVYNGVSDDYFHISESKNLNVIIFVGSRAKYKNFDLAVLAVSLTDDFELHIVGGGALTQQEVATLEKYLPNRYRWLGYLANDELNSVFNSAHCLLYPSSYEGFGIPILEAMRAGCPVISSNKSSIPEVAGNAAILIGSLNPHDYKDAILNLNIISGRSDYVSKGLEQAKKFSWDKCFSETLSIYNELN
jgi:mannosyltransferase